MLQYHENSMLPVNFPKKPVIHLVLAGYKEYIFYQNKTI